MKGEDVPQCRHTLRDLSGRTALVECFHGHLSDWFAQRMSGVDSNWIAHWGERPSSWFRAVTHLANAIVRHTAKW